MTDPQRALRAAPIIGISKNRTLEILSSRNQKNLELVTCRQKNNIKGTDTQIYIAILHLGKIYFTCLVISMGDHYKKPQSPYRSAYLLFLSF